jgi:hypothetical protein
MRAQRWELVLWLALTAVVATPVFGQTVAPAAASKTAAVPDFSGVWRHPSLPGFEPPASGPGPVTNRSRRNGVSDWDQLVGDYTNPILKPDAAEIVRQHGEISKSGVTYPTPANQCWPEPVPYIFWNFGMEMLQLPDRVVLLYANPDQEVRQVRLNQPHPAQLSPTLYGDSVGHYEGQMLVIDTVGVRTDRPFAMVDAYGTPYTEALHVVERYRLLDYEAAKEGLDRDAKENFRVPVDINRNYRGKHLQLQFTVEDEGVFTMPWSATITYGRGSGEWEEEACAENRRGNYDKKDAEVPTADKPDF